MSKVLYEKRGRIAAETAQFASFEVRRGLR